jgi:regulator of sirC expression with transglutaminase-like and TPR domain
MEAFANPSPDPRATARERFAGLVGEPDDQPPLVETALVIALEECPELAVRKYLACLHAYTSVVSDRVREAAGRDAASDLPVEERIRILNRYVFGDLGFHGLPEAYHDPRSSLLNEVIDRRIGIPITLSLVYMELAKGAGVRLAGVGFPGHFLVKTQGESPIRLLDPMNGGVELDDDGLEQLIKDVGAAGIDVAAALRAVDNRAIVRRLLVNLKTVYLRQSETERALAAVERLLVLDPDEPRELFERGLLCGRLGRYAEAMETLERLVEVAPESEFAERVESHRTRFRYWRSRLN